jgi:4-nitrophenyl phosphatase
MEIANQEIDTLFLDCDGVIWEDKTPIEGSIAALKTIQDLGVRLFFVSNNSSHTRSEYVAKFATLGLVTTKDQMVVSSWGMRTYLKENHPDLKKVFVVGPPSLAVDIRKVGVEVIAGRDLNFTLTSQDDLGLDIDPEIGVVISACDMTFNYKAGLYACQCI